MALCACVLAISLTTGGIDLPVQHHGTMMGVDGRVLLFDLVDARSYSHCHNLPRRIYCHKTRRLPSNWPPNTDTPGTSKRPQPQRKRQISDPARELIEGSIESTPAAAGRRANA